MKIDELAPQEAVSQELGRRLEQTRKQRSLSQMALARQAGIGVATLRRIEDGQDAQMGSWIKLMRALNQLPAIDALLPEDIRSPMAEVMAEKGRKRPGKQSKQAWGDEQV